MKTILLIIWMICTILLTCTVIGMLVFIPTIYTNGPNEPSTWMKIGIRLLDDVIK